MNGVAFEKKEFNVWQFASTLLATYIAISSVFPPLKAFSFFKISWLIAMILWGALAFLSKPDFFIRLPLQRAGLLFFTVYAVGIANLFGNQTIGNRYLDVAQIPFFYLVYQYHCSNGFHKSNLQIIKWTLPFLLVTCVKTGFALLTQPYLARTVKSGGEYSEMLWSQGIGGYELIYFLTLVSAVILYVLLNHKTLQLTVRLRIALIVTLALFYTIIILSNFFTAFLLTIIAGVGYLLLKRRDTMQMAALLFIVSVGIALFGKQLLVFGLDVAMDIIQQGKNLDRLLIIRDSLTISNSMDILFSERTPVYQESLTAFLKNPLLGIVVNPVVYRGDYLSGFGQHSQFLDTFALFGLFAGLVQIYYILQPFVLRMKRYTPLAGFSFIMMLITIILFTFNNVTTSVGLAIFLIYPVVYSWLMHRLEKTSADFYSQR